MKDYEIKLINVKDNLLMQKVVDLQNLVYADRGNRFSIEGMRWWYIDNPMGTVISFNAFYGEKIVAHYACIPIKMKIDDRIVDGLLDMATVTHPEHRGKGLFKSLAKTTYEYASQNGFEFIIGVANANSFPGYMKYFPFTFVSKLDVKWGWGKVSLPKKQKMFSGYWTSDSLSWRLGKEKYSQHLNTAFGIYGSLKVGIKTLMGVFPYNSIELTNIKKSLNCLRPLNLYVGLGADLSQGHYYDFPKFVKHSPFNLIFLDLTGGEIPTINKDNIFFQLIDFDVA